MTEAPSDRAAGALRVLGGVAPVCTLERALAARRGLRAARLSIDLAILAGRLERVAMVNGSPGLQLVGERP